MTMSVPLHDGSGNISPQSHLKKRSADHNHSSNILGESRRQAVGDSTASFLASATYNAHLFASSTNAEEHHSRISGGVSSSSSSTARKGKPSACGNGSGAGKGQERRNYRDDSWRKEKPPPTSHSTHRHGAPPTSGHARSKSKHQGDLNAKEASPRAQSHSDIRSGAEFRDGLSMGMSLSVFDLET